MDGDFLGGQLKRGGHHPIGLRVAPRDRTTPSFLIPRRTFSPSFVLVMGSGIRIVLQTVGSMLVEVVLLRLRVSQ